MLIEKYGVVFAGPLASAAEGATGDAVSETWQPVSRGSVNNEPAAGIARLA